MGRGLPPHRPGLFAAVAMAGAGLAASPGCRESFHDEAFGVLDLASAYDGGTPADPLAGLPTEISVEDGFVAAERAQYYDFGFLPVLRDQAGTPRAVVVQPMYFFFASDPAYSDAPLFSAPVRESRDGVDSMPGGRKVRDPNPKDFCAGVPMAEQADCTEKNRVERKKPYAVRLRDLLVDPRRGRADYQRPIIDVIPGNAGYTGFWEIVEVRAPAGYDPDAIKHADTMARAVSSGDFKRRATGKVIDCPVLDERTYVPTGITSRPIPRPRIELWYRRKLTFCYLAHGWETLGTEAREAYFAGEDDQRVDTFDVSRVVVGQGTSEATRIVVPVARAYVPVIRTFDPGGSDASSTVTVSGNMVTEGLPRHTLRDPPGYSPVRWMWDFPVERDYVPGSITSLTTLDRTLARAQMAAGRSVVRNVPVRGTAVRCSLPEIVKTPFGGGRTRKYCGREVPNPDDPTGDPLIDARGDPGCTALGLECNKDTCFCDAPFVGYGRACGPGIAQCSPEKDAYSEAGTTCFPPFGGFCYLACKPTEPNTRAADNEGKKAAEFIDSRCKELPGYRCLRYLTGGICAKLCDQNVMDPMQCSAKTLIDKEIDDLGDGQTCQDYGLEICSWPDDYTPTR